MPLTQEQKTEIVGKFGRDGKDTGSTRVQIALLKAAKDCLLLRRLKMDRRDLETPLIAGGLQERWAYLYAIPAIRGDVIVVAEPEGGGGKRVSRVLQGTGWFGEDSALAARVLFDPPLPAGAYRAWIEPVGKPRLRTAPARWMLDPAGESSRD